MIVQKTTSLMASEVTPAVRNIPISANPVDIAAMERSLKVDAPLLPLSSASWIHHQDFKNNIRLKIWRLLLV